MGEVIEIQLTDGQTAFVDKADADLSGFSWNALRAHGENRFYAIRKDSGRSVYMHRIILARALGRLLLTRTEQVDHIDGNGLNNRRSNLRLATASENQRNKRTPSTNTSGYKGVSWHKRAGKWVATITLHHQLHYLGLFDDPQVAYAAYCRAAKELHGEFGRLDE